MTIVMDVQSCMKATLLAIIILSMVTCLPHIYSCVKNFMESLPSFVSAFIAPKCLFIFSNIIIVYLVSESKISRRRSKMQKIGEGMLHDSHNNHEDVVLSEVLLPAIIGESEQQQESKMVMLIDKEKDVDMLTAVDEERETSVVNHVVSLNQYEENVDLLVVHDVNEVHKQVEEGGDHELELKEEVSGDVEKEDAVEDEMGEMDVPPADELNQRVEDFIARFNMERQLEEARMLVSCY